METVYHGSVMFDPSSGALPVNSFALVTYVPDPLASFLDRLRTDLEPHSLSPRAHVTILPPRALEAGVTAGQAWDFIEKRLPDFPALEIDLGPVEMFPATNVVYVSIRYAFQQLQDMHCGLNAGPVKFAECHSYHPHVTIAQKLTAPQAAEVFQKATERWEQYRGPRKFLAEAFTFVQNTTADRWRDLNEYVLAPAPTGSLY